MEYLSKISINEKKDKYFTWSFNFFFYVSQKKKRDQSIHGVTYVQRKENAWPAIKIWKKKEKNLLLGVDRYSMVAKKNFRRRDWNSTFTSLILIRLHDFDPHSPNNKNTLVYQMVRKLINFEKHNNFISTDEWAN